MAFTVERSFDGESTRQWLAERWHLAVLYTAIYLTIIFAGKSYMQTKQPLQLRKALIFWNGALAIFSIFGTLRIMPEFLGTLTRDGFRNSYCRISDYYYEGVNGFWVYLFHLSKLFELGDTIFFGFTKTSGDFFALVPSRVCIDVHMVDVPREYGPRPLGGRHEFYGALDHVRLLHVESRWLQLSEMAATDYYLCANRTVRHRGLGDLRRVVVTGHG